MTLSFPIRAEQPHDAEAIRTLTTAAFAQAEHSSGTEAAIIDALRSAGALTLSLVAADGEEIVGHAAFSPVLIESRNCEWYGLGPISVRPDRQREGIGHALIEHGLERLKHLGAFGCVVLGDPAYYSRFGFISDSRLRYADVPPVYFQHLLFEGDMLIGEVTYHHAFNIA